MAEFEVKVYKLAIEEHPNADMLELAVVGDYRCIVPKGQFKTGDLGVYIPEAAICPDWLIKEMGLEGRLAGKQHNRVKAIKLRGVLSQGLVYPISYFNVQGEVKYVVAGESGINPESPSMNDFLDVEEGTDVTEFLDIVKYEPPIPSHMGGEVWNAFGYTLGYDIENFKKYPNVLIEGQLVSITEKIHGTWVCFGYHPDCDEYIVTSKGLSGKGVAFKMNDQNATNLYLRALANTADDQGYNVIDRMIAKFGTSQPVYILGEVFGKGVQDLHYGAEKPAFRVFDFYTGYPGAGKYSDAKSLPAICDLLGVDMVPELYSGEFSKQVMLELTSGKETVSGKKGNIREGVVIKPLCEERNPEIGRVILKSVSEEYLLRKGNTTEYN